MGLSLLMAATFVLFPYAGMGNNTSPYSVAQRDNSAASADKPVTPSQLTDLSVVELISFATIVAAGTFIVTDYVNKRLREKEQNKASMDKKEHPDNEEHFEEVETPPNSERIESTLEEIRRLKEAVGREEQLGAPVSLIDRTKFHASN